MLCGTLLRAAEAGLYRPCWSRIILAEVERTLIRLGIATSEQAQRRRAHMEAALPQAQVAVSTALIAAMTNETDDRHVLAAAVKAHATVIVTENRRHFSRRSLAPYGIAVQSADAFLQHLLDLDPDLMARIIEEQAGDLRNPPQSAAQVLDRLATHTPGFAQRVRERRMQPPSSMHVE